MLGCELPDSIDGTSMSRCIEAAVHHMTDSKSWGECFPALGAGRNRCRPVRHQQTLGAPTETEHYIFIIMGLVKLCAVGSLCHTLQLDGGVGKVSYDTATAHLAGEHPA